MAGTNSSGRPSEKSQLTTQGDQKPPPVPEDLGIHGRRLWQLAIQHLPHVLTTLDEPVLRLCAEAYQSAMERKDDPKRHKEFITSIGKFDALAGKIGLTPHSRRVIKPVPQSEETADEPWKQWVQSGGLN